MIYYIVKTKNGYVASQYNETQNIDKAKTFKSPELAKKFIVDYRYGSEITEITEVTLQEKSFESLDSTSFQENLAITSALDYNFKYFWKHLCKLGIADKVQYLAYLDSKSWRFTSEELKNARDSIRCLGIKTNEYRSQGKFFAFMNKDQFFAAKMTMNIADQIDVSLLRETHKLKIQKLKNK